VPLTRTFGGPRTPGPGPIGRWVALDEVVGQQGAERVDIPGVDQLVEASDRRGVVRRASSFGRCGAGSLRHADRPPGTDRGQPLPVRGPGARELVIA
jgi:hypothetical protein